ncbi:hypothetical protein GCM10028803_51180 [Larkinella knui]|uniref:TonB C-terminal domain-containing protein n=1 Tax=Larkinella knui TaxID=2025310 RepID=A0A3P1CH56_9BACT|nr:hypothetical protein [Larkinella knui]RRB12662.1 hypothetical protein EHT87_20970 [Larkinella knui]
MKMTLPSFRDLALIGALISVAISIDVMAQPGLNSGKPIITYNTMGLISIETQSPPSFPGGEEKLVDFILENFGDADPSLKLGKKTWLTATIDGQGKVISLVPSDNNDPVLKKEMTRIGTLMPRWTPGRINKKGVETLYQFLVRRY